MDGREGDFGCGGGGVFEEQLDFALEQLNAFFIAQGGGVFGGLGDGMFGEGSVGVVGGLVQIFGFQRWGVFRGGAFRVGVRGALGAFEVVLDECVQKVSGAGGEGRRFLVERAHNKQIGHILRGLVGGLGIGVERGIFGGGIGGWGGAGGQHGVTENVESQERRLGVVGWLGGFVIGDCHHP